MVNDELKRIGAIRNCAIGAQHVTRQHDPSAVLNETVSPSHVRSFAGLCAILAFRLNAIDVVNRRGTNMPSSHRIRSVANEWPEGPRPPLRSDFRSIQKLYGDRRPADRLIVHYQIEIELAERLRCSTKENRKLTYREVYNDLITKVSDHPRNTRARDAPTSRN